jgi:hypothetical protein
MHQFLAVQYSDPQIPLRQFKGNRAADDAAAHNDDVICIHKFILAVNAGTRSWSRVQIPRLFRPVLLTQVSSRKSAGLKAMKAGVSS